MRIVLPVPIFADSVTTVGIQLADIAAGISRKYHSERKANENLEQNMFYEKLLKYYTLISQRSLNKNIERYQITGFFVSGDDYIL